MESMEKNSGAEGARAPHHLPFRTILNGKYMVQRVLGEGGFGITYEGWDLNLELKVAIKEYYPSGFVTRGNTEVIAYTGGGEEYYEKGKQKFLSEAKTLARFYFLPGIVGVKDFFLENNTAYIVMEFLDGVTLKTYTEQAGGRLPSQQVLDFMRPVMHSLAEVHKSGLIHRDISPENIMITKEGQVKLLDFGAARDISPEGEKSLSVLLKPGYAPEEQYRTHGEQGPWTDVYALCATIYRCVTGESPEEPLERARHDELKPPSMMGAQLTPQQDMAIVRGLSLYAENRFQNVEELEAALYGGSFTGEPPVPEPQTNINRTLPENPAANPYAMPEGNIQAAPVMQKEGKKRGKKVIIGLIALICILAGGIIWVLSTGKRGGTAMGSSNGNIHNNGFVASGKSGDVYACRLGGYLAVENSIGNWEVIEGENGGYVNVWKNWIYYLDEDYRVVKRPLSDPEKSPQTVGGREVGGFLISGGTIYYFDDDGAIHRMNLDGSKDEVINSGENIGLNIENGWVYFLRNEGSSGILYKMKTDGTKLQKVGTDESEMFIVQDGWVYYTNMSKDNELYRMRVDGSQNQSLGIGEADMFNICGDWIYYQGVDHDRALCRVKKDGSGEKVLDSKVPELLFSSGDTVYYIVQEDSDASYSLYSMPVNGSKSELVLTQNGKTSLAEKTPQRETEEEPSIPQNEGDGGELMYQGEPFDYQDTVIDRINQDEMQNLEVGTEAGLTYVDYRVEGCDLADGLNSDGSQTLKVYISFICDRDMEILNYDFMIIAMKENADGDDEDLKLCVASSMNDNEFPVKAEGEGVYSAVFEYKVPYGYEYILMYTNIIDDKTNGSLYLTYLYE
ncbi:DUF5050 domain-containing protein [Lacrimispora sp. NSJ-141]|uniref:DUF5050 domain-containing protein n=1 Tax=Lientehia hominis TaxID=2897778 RepID=A0AAP2RJZ9_9FIRM|nr:DUF5050 domain-containing protein [Lientehia hominis]MCD2493025.1 DUF5050 domain-containing protein [Lientehia hominis]